MGWRTRRRLGVRGVTALILGMVLTCEAAAAPSEKETSEFDKVWKLYEDGQYAEFIKAATTFLREDPHRGDPVRLRHAIAASLGLTGRFDEALTYLRGYLKEHPYDWHEGTLRHIDFLQNTPGSAARRRYYEMRRRYEKARKEGTVEAYDRLIAEIDRAIGDQPTGMLPYILRLMRADAQVAVLGLEIDKTGKYDLAAHEKIWQEFKSQTEKLGVKWMWLDVGRGLLRAQYWRPYDAHQAERLFRTVVDVCDEGLKKVDDVDVQTLLDVVIAIAQGRLRQKAKLLESYQRANDRKASPPIHLAARSSLAWALAYDERTEEALAILEEMRKAAPKAYLTSVTALQLGYAVSTRDPALARKLFQGIVDTVPGTQMATYAKEAIDRIEKRPTLATKRPPETEWPTGGFRPDDEHRVVSRMFESPPLTGEAVTKGRKAMLAELLKAGKVTKDVYDRETAKLQPKTAPESRLDEVRGRLDVLTALFHEGELDTETFLKHYVPAKEDWYHLASILPNGDFEELEDAKTPPRLIDLKQWHEEVWGHMDLGQSEVAIDRQVKRRGKQSVRFTAAKGPSSIELESPKFMCRRDDSLRILFWVKAKDLKPGRWGVAASLHFFKSESPGWPALRVYVPSGTYDWMPLEARLNIFANVPEGEEEPCFIEFQFFGEGTLWVDDITIVPTTRR